MAKLKPVELKKLKAGLHCDGGGLYLNVEEAGSRSWLLRVSINGKRHWMGLGSLALVSLADARVEAVNLRARARKGEDVLAERRASKQAEQHQNLIPTFEAAARSFHATMKKNFNSETHAYNWLQSLELYAFPVFGKKTVDKIDSADILAAILPIWTDKADTASRTLRRIKKIFDFCTNEGHRKTKIDDVVITMPNPCETIRASLPKHNGVENHHEALPYAELPAFISRLRIANNALSVKLAFEFLILTCARTNEVIGAKWEEIDLDSRVWTIPADRMKMDKEHKVPLSARCIEILNLAKQFNDGAIVFPGRYPGQPLSNASFLMAMRRMGYESLTAHGFRATFKTWAEETTKFDSLVIEASMAHAVKGIERHYLRTTFFTERCKLMDAWVRFATAAPTTKVVSIGRTNV